MPSFTRVFVLAGLALMASAVDIPASLTTPITQVRCDNAAFINTTTIGSNENSLVLSTFSCEPAAAGARKRDTSSTDAVNICGTPTTTACTDVTGILPPIAEDCAQISNSMQIFAAQVPSISVASNRVVTLTFGTCSYFIQNTGPLTVSVCNNDVVTKAEAAGAACFPPHQPFFPEGASVSCDQKLLIGATHS